MKYNILYFLDYGKSFGGAANTLLQQAILMKKAGHEVTIFMSDYYDTDIEKGYQEICFDNQISFNWLTYQICFHTEDIDIMCLLQNYDSVKEIIKGYKPDILHTIQINPLIELISRDLKIPHIMNIYSLIPAFFSIDYLDIFPHYHICDSEYYAKKWNKYLDTDYTCIRTVVNKNSEQEKLVTKNEEINYICVGSVYKQKNQLGVIKAFHKAMLSGLKGTLAVYGYNENVYGEQCQRYIEENSLQGSISMKGFCSDMQSEYVQADVLICGSTRESYPNVISEAMANGLVVVSTPVGGIPEIIEDGINGYLSIDYTSDSICDKILESYRDYKSGRINTILKNSYKTFQENHSPEIVTRNLLNYYSYVIDNYKEIKEITIHHVEECFAKLINFYQKNKSVFTDSKFIERKLWYIYHIQDILDERKKNTDLKYYIWGTGKYATCVKEIIEVFFPEIMIEGYIDTYRKGYFGGKKIDSPTSILKNENSIVFVGAANGQIEIIEEFESNGKSCNANYFILVPRRW